MIIHSIPVSWHIHASQNHGFTILPTCFSSYTLKSTVRHNFCSTKMKMKLGAPPGAVRAVTARVTLPTQVYKINRDTYGKFQLPSLYQGKDNLHTVFDGWAETPASVSGESWSLLEQPASSKHIVFPLETFSAFSELLLRTRLRFKLDHISLPG